MAELGDTCRVSSHHGYREILGANRIVRNVECGDQVATAAAAAARQSRTIFTAAFICIAFFVLLIVMMIHQRQESAKTPVERMKNRWKRGIWLGLVANLIGSGMLLLFIYMRLKGTL